MDDITTGVAPSNEMPPRRRGKNPETLLTHQLREVLKAMKVPHFKHWGGMFGSKGISDIIGTLPPDGRALFCEVKCPGKNLKPDQRCFLDMMASSGAVAICTHSVDELLAQLSAHGFEPATRIKTWFAGGNR